MKGLLIKEFYSIKTQSKVMLYLILFYIVISVVTKSSAMLTAISTLVSLMLVLNNMAYDEQFKWDTFALTAPIDRHMFVRSKYLMVVIINVLLTALMTLLIIAVELLSGGGVEAIRQSILSALSLMGVSFLMMSILIPFVFKLGVQKSRIIMMIIVAIPFASIAVFGQIFEGAPLDLSRLRPLLYFAPVLIALLFFLSYRVSCGIMGKKEL